MLFHLLDKNTSEVCFFEYVRSLDKPLVDSCVDGFHSQVHAALLQSAKQKYNSEVVVPNLNVFYSPTFKERHNA